MTEESAPAGVVLTGGASRRMGSDKAFVEVDGVPMAVRVAAALTDGGCAPVECQGGDLDRIAALGLTAIPDVRRAAGPLAAIADAIERHGTVVVAACDLAWLDGPSVALLIRVVRAGAPAAALHADGRPHLATCWDSAALGPVRDAVRAGRRAVMPALAEVCAVDVAVDPAVVRNVNRPADLV